jgi:Spy/CpxP family protein refolding chaperone
MNSLIPHGTSCGRAARKSLVAAIVLAAMLSLGVAAFGQDDQNAPPPPPASDQQSGQPSGQPSEQRMGRHMGGRGMMPSVDDQIKHLTKKLNLSADQQTKLKPILEDQRKQMDAIHNDASLSREDRFSKMQTLRQSSDTEIKGVLNEDQQKSFDKMREEQHDRMGKGRKGGASAPPSGDSQQ